MGYKRVPGPATLQHAWRCAPVPGLFRAPMDPAKNPNANHFELANLLAKCRSHSMPTRILGPPRRVRAGTSAFPASPAMWRFRIPPFASPHSRCATGEIGPARRAIPLIGGERRAIFGRRMNRDGDLIDPASLPEPRASRFAAGNRLRGVRRLWPSSSDRRPGMACRDSRPRGCASEHCRIRTGRLTACAGLAKKVSLEAAGKRPEYSEAGSPDPRDGTVPAQPPESHASSLQPPDSISSHAWRTTGRPGAPDPPERFTGHPQT